MKLFMLQDEVDRLAARFAGVASENPPEAKKREREPVKLRGGVATIAIKGPLYPKANSWLDYWGEDYTVYSDIISDVAEAEFRGATSIDFEIDSPGGYIDGLYEAMQAISATKIPTRTLAGKTLASAAYMLASQTGEIVAESPVSSIGSIGIATTMMVLDFIVDITNRESKKKRPDVSTDEGKGVVEDELDDFWAIFAEMMAKGRGVSVKDIEKNYGQGAVMTARTALQKGMIDGIMNNQSVKTTAAKIGAERMDLEQLKAEWPGLYAQVLAIGKEQGAKEAKEKERKRVLSHLKMGDASGDHETALTAIKEGDAADMDALIHHQSIAMNRNMQEAHLAGNPPDIGEMASTTPQLSAEDRALVDKFKADHPDVEVW